MKWFPWRLRLERAKVEPVIEPRRAMDALRQNFEAHGFQIVDSDPATAGMGGMTMRAPHGFNPQDLGGLLGSIVEHARRGYEANQQADQEGNRQDNRQGIQPPTDARDRQADSLGWVKWLEIMNEHPVPGWAPCRFVNRLGPTDRIGWVFGVVRDSFGVWSQPYPVCHHPMDEADHDFKPSAILATITHLPTGMGMGVFNDRATACAAAELLDGLEDWRNMPQTDGSEPSKERWGSLVQKVYRTWEFNGIDYSADWHAHNGVGGEHIGIWTKQPALVEDGKPKAKGLS